MPWREQAMKDAANCEKPRLAVSKPSRGFPNGETRRA